MLGHVQTHISWTRMVEVFVGQAEEVLEWSSRVLRAVLTLAEMLGSGPGDELDVARVVHATVVPVDRLVLLVLPREPSRLVPLKADLVDVDGVADDGRLQAQLDRVLRGRNSVLKHLHVDVLHQLHRVLLRVVVDLVEVRLVVAAFEQVAAVAALPRSVVESDQRRVDADVRAALEHFVGIAGADPGHKRDPR